MGATKSTKDTKSCCVETHVDTIDFETGRVDADEGNSVAMIGGVAFIDAIFAKKGAGTVASGRCTDPIGRVPGSPSIGGSPTRESHAV